MNYILNKMEEIITFLSDSIWPVFLPCMLIAGAYLSVKTFKVVKKKCTKPSNVEFKHIIGPASISLGAMIGTGAIIGVLGALSKYSASGEVNVEAMAFWAIIGSIIMIPVSYANTLISKIMNKMPKEYIGDILSKHVAFIYAISFVVLVSFGFAGFQFSGIDSVTAIVSKKYVGINLTEIQRFMFVIVPIILIVAAVVLTKKHDIFMNAMTYMISIAVVAYFIFFITFLCMTGDYVPVYIEKIIAGVRNPVNGFSGIILGFVLGMQKVLQTAETGLGGLAMAAQEADTKPREAAVISMIPTIITVFVSIIVTSYITSFGLNEGIINLPDTAVNRLSGYFSTAEHVTGHFGLVILSIFTILSALTTILGAYYYLVKLFGKNNKNITIYLTLVVISASLAVFGGNVVFEAVDLLLFVICGINVLALSIFAHKGWKKYVIKE